MRPAIQGGEWAYAEPYRGQKLIGHIVATDKVTHRVVDENAKYIYLSGDANKRSDGWVSKQTINYVIVYIVRS